MFRASICPSSGVYMLYTTAYGVKHCKRELCVSGWAQHVLCSTGTQYDIQYNLNQQLHNEQHKMKPPTNVQFSFTVLNTICSSIQPVCSWRWAYGCLKHVELFMIINKIFASSWYLSLFLDRFTFCVFHLYLYLFLYLYEACPESKDTSREGW